MADPSILTSAVEPEVSTARRSERASFADYVHTRQSALLGFAYLLCGDFHAAEDLVQDVLAKVFLRWGRLGRDDINLDAYVHRMIVNENASLWRRAWKRRERSSDAVPDAAVAPPNPDETTWRLVAELPTQQRAVVALRFYLDASVAETAATLNISPGTVKSHTSRALASLRRSLETRTLPTEEHG